MKPVDKGKIIRICETLRSWELREEAQFSVETLLIRRTKFRFIRKRLNKFMKIRSTKELRETELRNSAM